MRSRTNSRRRGNRPAGRAAFAFVVTLLAAVACTGIGVSSTRAGDNGGRTSGLPASGGIDDLLRPVTGWFERAHREYQDSVVQPLSVPTGQPAPVPAKSPPSPGDSTISRLMEWIGLGGPPPAPDAAAIAAAQERDEAVRRQLEARRLEQERSAQAQRVAEQQRLAAEAKKAAELDPATRERQKRAEALRAGDETRQAAAPTSPPAPAARPKQTAEATIPKADDSAARRIAAERTAKDAEDRKAAELKAKEEQKVQERKVTELKAAEQKAKEQKAKEELERTRLAAEAAHAEKVAQQRKAAETAKAEAAQAAKAAEAAKAAAKDSASESARGSAQAPAKVAQAEPKQADTAKNTQPAPVVPPAVSPAAPSAPSSPAAADSSQRDVADATRKPTPGRDQSDRRRAVETRSKLGGRSEATLVAKPSHARVRTAALAKRNLLHRGLCASAGSISSDTGQYVVKRGDTLWGISRRYYDQGIRYDKIVRANPGKINDPDLIFPCQRFRLPGRHAFFLLLPPDGSTPPQTAILRRWASL